jgi:hypothetical protein
VPHKAKVLVQSQRAFVGQLGLQDTLQRTRIAQNSMAKVVWSEHGVSRGCTSSASASRIASRAMTTSDDPAAQHAAVSADTAAD